MKKLFLLTVACCFGLLPSSVDSQGEFFYLYPWACPSVEAFEEAYDAAAEFDEDAFEDTNCQSIRPETEYRVLRCDEGITGPFLDRFDYPIPRTDELPSQMCELAVTQSDGSVRTLLTGIGKIAILKPKQSP